MSCRTRVNPLLLRIIDKVAFGNNTSKFICETSLVRWQPRWNWKHPLLKAYMSCRTSVNLPLLRIIDKVDFRNNKRKFIFETALVKWSTSMELA
jgi:hypothetical protein